MIQPNINGWNYIHFNDDGVIKFFEQTRIDGKFTNIIDKFHSIPVGATKADLFRYYFLYINGGVFMDSDAMLLVNIDEIVKDYSFFSVNTYVSDEPAIFQGFIGCTPRHPIIEKALIDLYETPVDEIIQDFHRQPKKMYEYYHEDNQTNKVLYGESHLDNPNYSTVWGCTDGLIGEDTKKILKHYYVEKIVPKKTD
jgi:mannosyltransferase OCH1-like enzyme